MIQTPEVAFLVLLAGAISLSSRPLRRQLVFPVGALALAIAGFGGVPGPASPEALATLPAGFRAVTAGLLLIGIFGTVLAAIRAGRSGLWLVPGALAAIWAARPLLVAAPLGPVASRGGRHCHDRDARARHRSPLADPLMGRGSGPAMAWITGPRDKSHESRHRLAGRRYAVHGARAPSFARLRRRGGGLLVGRGDGQASWNEQAGRSYTRDRVARYHLRLSGDRRRVGRSLDGGPRCAADQSRRRNSRRRRAARGELADVRTLAVARADIRSARGAGHHRRVGPSGSCRGTGGNGALAAARRSSRDARALARCRPSLGARSRCGSSMARARERRVGNGRTHGGRVAVAGRARARGPGRRTRRRDAARSDGCDGSRCWRWGGVGSLHSTPACTARWSTPCSQEWASC